MKRHDFECRYVATQYEKLALVDIESSIIASGVAVSPHAVNRAAIKITKLSRALRFFSF
jgi:hypothetical protein